MKFGLLNSIKELYSIVLFQFILCLQTKTRRKAYIRKKIVAFALFSCLPLEIEGKINLEENISSFVLESKAIKIPGYPYAYNPSIIRWKGKLLLSFRITYNQASPWDSELGLIWLDNEFNPISSPFFLDTKGPLQIPSRAEDGRLVQIAEKLYLIYSNNIEPTITRGGFRVYIAEIEIGENYFELKNKECLSDFEGENNEIREKNWVPFDYNGNLMLGYSLNPHFILKPMIGTGTCISYSRSKASINWEWGQLRGGTPALNIDGTEYLAFFHTSKQMLTQHSMQKTIWHYFMGAYTFSAEFPFAITKISPEPIIGEGFYSGIPYTSYYWNKCQRVIFPAGYLYDDEFIWVAYGRDDHEIWIVKLHRQGLMQSLIPVMTIN